MRRMQQSLIKLKSTFWILGQLPLNNIPKFLDYNWKRKRNSSSKAAAKNRETRKLAIKRSNGNARTEELRWLTEVGEVAGKMRRRHKRAVAAVKPRVKERKWAIRVSGFTIYGYLNGWCLWVFSVALGSLYSLAMAAITQKMEEKNNDKIPH